MISPVTENGRSLSSFTNGQYHYIGKSQRARNACIVSALRLLPPRWRQAIIMTLKLGYLPSISQPRTFNEKIAHRMLLEYDARFHVLADKWAVRDYVGDTVGNQYLSEVFAVVSNLPEFDLGGLPERFVAKPTHYSGQEYFVARKSDLDSRDFFTVIHRWLNSTYKNHLNEYWYQEMSPRVICEEWLADQQNAIPTDYKFWVIHGRAEAIEVVSNRYALRRREFCSREWQKIPMSVSNVGQPNTPLCRPAKLEEMVAVAEELGKDFDFVRVDLYCLDDRRIVFGEMTFAPSSGRTPFSPRSYDFEFGKLW